MLRGLALLLTVLTGFTGLVYEVAWQRYLATLVGSHSEATAAVLGLFLAGLALGYALFGRVTRGLVQRASRRGRPPRLLLVYGGVEGAIGLYGLAFPFAFAAVQALSLRVPHASGGAGFAFDVALSALLIGPPTVLMGGTIPMLTQALARSRQDATRFHAFVYGFNTVGAFAGALAAGFVLVPRLGLDGVVTTMGVVNVAVGALFAGLGLRRRRVFVETPSATPARPPQGATALAAVALLAGFAMMTVQTVLNRLGALSFGGSPFTFSMVVATFVLCIAVGSFGVSALRRVRPGHLLACQWGLVALLALLYFRLPEAPYWGHVVRTLFRDTDAAFYPFYAVSFLLLVAVLGPAIVLSGALLPLLFHQLRGETGELGAAAGRLYAWNTLGSLLGALLGGYALLHWMDLHHVYRIALAAVAAGGVILTLRLTRLGPLPVGAAGAAACALLVLMPAWDPRLLASGLFRHRSPNELSYQGVSAYLRSSSRYRRVLFYDDDPNASVAVTEVQIGGHATRSIVNNGKPDGNTRFDYGTMGLLALLPALVAERAEDAFVIGVGTGVTMGELTRLDSVKRVVAAEISPGVIEALPLFDAANGGVSRDPAVEIVQSDAYRALLRSQDRFDLIVSEPSNPWVAGVEMLYSREFLEAARDRLSPGGVFAQWFHQYETDAESVELVLRTYGSVFDRVAVWYGIGPDLLLLGLGPDTRVDLDRIAQRIARPDFAAGLERSGIPGLPELLAHELLPVGVLNAAELRGPLHTLLHPRLNDLAGRAFFRGEEGSLPFTGFGRAARLGRERSLLLQLARRHGGALPEAMRERAVREACLHRTRLCASLLASWRRQEPSSEALERTVAFATGVQGRFGGALAREDLDAIQPLFDEDGEGRVVAAAAAQASRSYETYYQHAAPFDPAGLLSLWRRCRSAPGPGPSCLDGLQSAHNLLDHGRDGGRPGS